MSCNYGYHHHGHHEHHGQHEHHGHHDDGHEHHGHDRHHRGGQGVYAAAHGRGPTDHRSAARVKEGDVLVCGCRDCNVELTVSKACAGDVCGVGCDVEVSCCGEPMRVKAS